MFDLGMFKVLYKILGVTELLTGKKVESVEASGKDDEDVQITIRFQDEVESDQEDM